MFRILKRSYVVSLEKLEIIKETPSLVTYVKILSNKTAQPLTERKHSSEIVWTHSYLEAVEIIKNHIQKEIETAEMQLAKTNSLLSAFNNNFPKNEFPDNQNKISITNL